MDLATLGLAVDSRPVADAAQDLDRISAAAGKAERAADSFGARTESAGRRAAAANDNAAKSADNVAASYGRWEKAAMAVGRVVGLIAGALATGALIQYADAWSDMQSRVGSAIRDMDAAPAMMQRIVDIANASYSPLSQTVEVFSRNVATLRDMGRGAAEAADFTEALNNALIVNATKGQDAEVVLNSLSRAIATGALNAQDFDTIVSRTPRVLEAIADELGTNVSGLRELAKEGKATGEVIVSGLLNSFQRLQEEAEAMPATVGDAFTILRNNVTAFVGQMDQATGMSEALSAAIMLLANNIDTIARVAAIAGIALLTAFAPTILAAIASGFVAIGTAGVAAMTAITVAIAANPLGALAVAIATIITAVYLFRDEISQVFGVDIVGTVEGVANRIIGTMVGAYQAVIATWQLWPAALGDFGYQAAQLFLDSVVWMAREAISIINGLVASINGALRGAGVDMQLPDLGAPVSAVPSIKLKNPYAGTRAQVGDIAAGAMRDALSRDYVGGADAAGEASRSAADAIRDMNSAMEEVGGAGGSGGRAGSGSAAKAAEGLKQVEDAAEAAKKSLGEGFGGILKGLISGTMSWKDALSQALDLLMKYLQQSSAGSGGGGGFFGGLMNSLLGGFGGFFANGGTLGAGKWGIAGERGPEIVRGPAQIIPMNRAPANSDHAQPRQVEVRIVGSLVDDNGTIKARVDQSEQRSVATSAGQLDRYDKSQRAGGVAVNQSYHQMLKRR